DTILSYFPMKITHLHPFIDVFLGKFLDSAHKVNTVERLVSTLSFLYSLQPLRIKLNQQIFKFLAYHNLLKVNDYFNIVDKSDDNLKFEAALIISQLSDEQIDIQKLVESIRFNTNSNCSLCLIDRLLSHSSYDQSHLIYLIRHISEKLIDSVIKLVSNVYSSIESNELLINSLVWFKENKELSMLMYSKILWESSVETYQLIGVCRNTMIQDIFDNVYKLLENRNELTAENLTEIASNKYECANKIFQVLIHHPDLTYEMIAFLLINGSNYVQEECELLLTNNTYFKSVHLLMNS
ncbi:MAG: hypothetical protein ACRCZC_02400, partial [Culicoidibacterales bacterium]